MYAIVHESTRNLVVTIIPYMCVLVDVCVVTGSLAIIPGIITSALRVSAIMFMLYDKRPVNDYGFSSGDIDMFAHGLGRYGRNTIETTNLDRVVAID